MLARNLTLGILLCLVSLCGWAQSPPSKPITGEPARDQGDPRAQQSLTPHPARAPQDYRIGPDDLLEVFVFEAPDLSRAVRVSASGRISLPLLGVVQVAGLSPRGAELLLQDLLRRTYMKDPQVSVQVSEMQSHSVSVMGAVRRPGVYQIRGMRTLLEVLALAEGPAEDAGESVLVVRGAGAGALLQPEKPEQAAPLPGKDTGAKVEEISLRKLMESEDSSYNVFVYPGDIVKVKQAGVVYVVGEVKKPGGFPLKNNEKLTVLQALALGEGLTPMAAKGSSMILRTAENGEQSEIPVDLGKILKGKAPDLPLQPKDIVFVPSNTAKSFTLGTIEALVRMVTLRPAVFGP